MSQIDEALGIEFDRNYYNGKVVAIPNRLPGSPPVGVGDSELEAKTDLLEQLLWRMSLRAGGYSREVVFEILYEALGRF